MTSAQTVSGSPPLATRSEASAERLLARFVYGVLLADTLAVGLSIWIACEIRGQLGIWGESNANALPHLCLQYGPWMAAAWLSWLSIRGSYSQKTFGAGSEEFHRVFIASLLAAGSVAMVCYLTKFDLSRGFVLLTFMIGIPALLIERFAARKWLHRQRTLGRMQHRVLVIGDEDTSAQVIEILNREAHAGYAVAGVCTREAAAINGASHINGIPVLGNLGDTRAAALSLDADAVLIVGGDATSEDVRRIAWSLEGSDVDLIVAPSLTDIAGPRVHIRPVAGLPLLHVEPPQAEHAVAWGKRAFDVVGSLALIALTLPIWIAVAVWIRLDDRGPVFFRQNRIGLHGVAFSCLKFRSMTQNAETLIEELRHLNECDGVLFKISDDPRITRVGRVIRRYSLDELPQLINVLRGDMSLVGPRPPLPTEVTGYEDVVGRRLLVRPGVTGLWQVSGRSSLSWKDSVRLDLYYVDNWSMFQDLVILARTLRAVVTGVGAS